MALSGPEALRSLDDAVRDIRREEADISSRLARATERVTKMQETEAGLFGQLARLKLSPDMIEQATGTLSRAEAQARKMLEQHASDLASLEAELETIDKGIAAQAKLRREALDAVDEQQAALKALSAQIARAIEKDPDYAAQKQRAEDLREIAAEAMEKTEQAEADRDQKGKPYRDDPLFMYLWEAGYGTRNYRANHLVRWLDGMVANLVGFHDARPNFAMLNDLPVRLREHAERQIQLSQQAEEKLDALELAAIDAAGGKPVREALSAAQSRLAAIDAEMLALEDERDEKATQHRHLGEGRDPQFNEAHTFLARALRGGRVEELIADARRTPTPEDDAILAKIEDARSRISEDQANIDEYKSRLKVLANRRRELEDIEFEFKKARYDDPRSTFREDRLAGDLLNEFLRGAMTAGHYWDQWQRSQSWKPGSTDWGGGFGLPNSGRASRSKRGGSFNWPSSSTLPTGNPWGRSSSGGGFSRPRSGSRGTRKSGGFKTGGGF